MIVKVFHGFCMALADSVPGVSGGTVAFILGFYEPFLNALHGLFGKDPAARRGGFVYLAKLGVGWCLGLGVSVVVLTNLYHTETYLLSSLFLGLTAASLPLILFRERGVLAGRLSRLPLAVLGCGLVCALSLLRRMSTTISGVDYLDLSVGEGIYLFLAGALAITAMVLPGISGSTLLLIFGVYVPTLHALRGLLDGDFSALPGLVMLCLGVLAGVGVSIRGIRAALRRHRAAMMYFIAGLMAGSLFAIAMGPTTLPQPQPALDLGTFHLPGFLAGILILVALERLRVVIARRERRAHQGL